jgi:hypothetical protein
MSNKKSQIILYHAKSEDIEKGVLKFIMDSAPYAFRRQLVLVGNPLFIHYRTLCGFTSHYWKEIFKKDKDRFLYECKIPRKYTIKDIADRAKTCFGDYYNRYFGDIFMEEALKMADLPCFDQKRYELVFQRVQKRLELKHEADVLK